MTLDELFKPKLSKVKQKAYKSNELERRKNKLIEEGYEGVEYKNKVFQEKKKLDREIKNGIFRKYYKPNGTHKQVFHAHISKHNLLPLFTPSDEIHYSLPQSVKTDIQFTHHISRQNLFSTVFPSFKRFDEGSFQPCIFSKDHVGWIAQDQDGSYRYCSKNLQTGVIFGFSLLDLIEISHIEEHVGTKMAYQMARTWLSTLLHVSYRDFNYVKQQKIKYKGNLATIDQAMEWKEPYPNLYAISNSQLYVLIELHEYASRHIMKRQHSIQKEAVFFVSARKLCKNYKEKYNVDKKDYSTFAAAINLFSTLGLLRKIPYDILKSKSDLLQIAMEIQGSNTHHHLINFMTIPHYNEDILNRAEKTAKQLRKFNITTAKDVTNKSLKEALGEKKANEIIKVREVSLQNMHADELQELAEKELGEFPWEAIEESMEKGLKATKRENDLHAFESPLYQMSVEELHERAMQHFELKEEENEWEGID